DRAAQQRGEVTGHRCHNQYLGVVAFDVALEVHQVAERLVENNLFGDGDILAVDDRGRQVKVGLAETARGALEDFGPGCDGATGLRMGEGVVRITIQSPG